MLNEIDSLSIAKGAGQEEIQSLDKVKEMVSHLEVNQLKKLQAYIGKQIEIKQGLTDDQIRLAVTFNKSPHRSQFLFAPYHLDRDSKDHFFKVGKIVVDELGSYSAAEMLRVIEFLLKFKHFERKMFWDDQYPDMYKVGKHISQYLTQNMPTEEEFNVWRKLHGMFSHQLSDCDSSEKAVYFKYHTFSKICDVVGLYNEFHVVRNDYKYFQTCLSKITSKQ